MADTNSQVSQVVEDFLSHLGLKADVGVEFEKENNIYVVNLSCDDPGPLIGHHGETLSSLQLMVGQHLKAKTGDWVNLVVNVNDYRQRREQTLLQLADNTVKQVVTTGQAHSLPPMPANERRIIHLHLADNDQVTTESMGEGRNRSVVISLKS